MAEAFVVGAVRTPVGRRGGGLSGVHPADLGEVHLVVVLEPDLLEDHVVAHGRAAGLLLLLGLRRLLRLGVLETLVPRFGLPMQLAS